MALLLEAVMWFSSSQWNIKKFLGENSGKAFLKEEWSANATRSFYFPGKVDIMAGVVAAILDYNISFRALMGQYNQHIL